MLAFMADSLRLIIFFDGLVIVSIRSFFHRHQNNSYFQISQQNFKIFEDVKSVASIVLKISGQSLICVNTYKTFIISIVVNKLPYFLRFLIKNSSQDKKWIIFLMKPNCNRFHFFFYRHVLFFLI